MWYNHSENAWMFVVYHYLAFSPIYRAILHWEESGWNFKCFKCNFICSQVLWKSLHWNLFCSSPLFHFPVRKLLFGSILGVISVSFSLFPPVNAMPSQNGFTRHVLRDGGCFHFYPLLNGKNCATDILRTDECDWGWLVAKNEAVSERTERRVKRTGCAVKEPNLTAFWVCEWKLQMLRAPPLTWTFIN